MNNIKLGIVGLGFVGSAMENSFKLKGFEIGNNLFVYDKFKEIGEFKYLMQTDILFLALPTQYSKNLKTYDKSAIYETCNKLKNFGYNGLVVIKSTVEPVTTNNLSYEYCDINFVHNPEFLTARSASEDFHKQKYILIGKTLNCSNDKLKQLVDFYYKYYPDAEIKVSSSNETELMKVAENSFCSVKIQFFNELYLLSKKLGIDYNNVRDLIVGNGKISEEHTNVPGPDGQLSYGGYCFPKDTNALYQFMEKNNSPNNVLQATIIERNIMRNDNDNIII